LCADLAQMFRRCWTAMSWKLDLHRPRVFL